MLISKDNIDYYTIYVIDGDSSFFGKVKETCNKLRQLSCDNGGLQGIYSQENGN